MLRMPPAVLVLSPVLLLVLLLSPSPGLGLLSLVHWLPPLFMAVFIVYFHKAGCDLDRFTLEFQHVTPHQKRVVSIGVMAAFVVMVLDGKKELEGGPDLNKFFMHTLVATMAVALLDKLRIHRCRASDWSQVVRRSPHSVARGLARAFHAYLTNVIVGMPGVSLPHVDALQIYLHKEQLHSDEFTWVGSKVLVFFPESNTIKDSVEDILKRERQTARGESHALVSETVRHRYEVAGKERRSVLHVIKLRHGGQDGWRNNYLIFAENRPLLALHQMVASKLLTPEELHLQFELYERELSRLLEEDEGCRDGFEVVRYQEGASLSEVLKQRIEAMEEEEVQVQVQSVLVEE